MSGDQIEQRSVVEDRIMSERRPQAMPPTPGNPQFVESERQRKYAALELISELGSDDPAEAFTKRGVAA